MTHIKFPEASNLEINTSGLFTGVKFTIAGPGSKSAVPPKKPIVITLPEASKAIEDAKAPPTPENCLTQTKLPEASNLEMNTSLLPADVRLVIEAPGSKSTEPLKDPVVNTILEIQ